MKSEDEALFLSLGVVMWILGTIYFARSGPAVLEGKTTRPYWTAFTLSALFSAALCIVLLRWRHIAPAHWPFAILLLAIPGMIGEAVVLANFARFMPKLRPASGGRYAALLFATYAAVLGLAEIGSLQ